MLLTKKVVRYCGQLHVTVIKRRHKVIKRQLSKNAIDGRVKESVEEKLTKNCWFQREKMYGGQFAKSDGSVIVLANAFM